MTDRRFFTYVLVFINMGLVYIIVENAIRIDELGVINAGL